MRLGTIISIVVAVLATGGMVLAFLSNASPYVTVKEARQMTRDGLHISGDIDKATMINDVRGGKVFFDLLDEKGERISVVYDGPPIANLGDATKGVVVGKMDGDKFAASKLIVKCPSKYEGDGAGKYKAGSGAEKA